MSETSKKQKRRHFETPLPDLMPAAPADGAHEDLNTLRRSAVLATLYFCQVKGIHCLILRLSELSDTDFISTMCFVTYFVWVLHFGGCGLNPDISATREPVLELNCAPFSTLLD